MRINGLELIRLVEQAQRAEDFAEAVANTMPAPVDVGSIVEFFDVPTADAFNVPAEDAIAYFQGKGLRPTFSYADMLGDAHDQAFTVAKMMDVDLLAKVRKSMDDAIKGGTTFKQWADDLVPELQKAGWWGVKEVVDPLTGLPTLAKLGTPWRLETIFRTNMQGAYAAGQWQEIEKQADVAPFLMYDAVDDFRTRPLHAAWDRTVLPVSSAWWKTHFPPNGWNCRCGVIQMDANDLKRLGLKVQDMPEVTTYAWKNPRTGEVLKVPEGIDPGFDKNAGVNHLNALQKQLNDKIADLPPTMKQAAAAAAAKAAEELAKVQRQTAAEILKAEQQAAANLARLRAKVAERAQEMAAQEAIDTIAKGKEAVGGVGAQYKVKALAQLSKGEAWPELKPSEKLAKIEEQAAVLKFQNEQSTKLAAYKKALIEGKTPAPNQVKAFNLLTPEEQAKLIEKVEAEKAAIAAKKAAEAQQAAQEAAAAAKAQAKPTSRVDSLLNESPPDPANMVMVGRKTKGGTEGAIYQDTTTGQRYMVKFNGSEDAVRNEVLAGKLYQLAGMEAPDLYSIRIDGRPAIASRMVDGIKEVGARELTETDSVMDGFAVDAWLANWDVIGMSYDNTVLIGGRALRIDVGGSLRYRAVGGLKGKAFGNTVGELDSLRDPSLNRTSYEVFKNITNDQIEAGVVKVLRTKDDDIRAIVEKYGPLDDLEREELIDKMIARKADLAKRYPNAARRAQGLDDAVDHPTAPAARVTDAEQQFVEESRVNGYGFTTDGDAIEDHMVVVHAFKRTDGSDATRGFFKLRPDASRELANRIAESTQDAAPSVSVSAAREAILAAVKSINFRADEGKAFDLTVENKVKVAVLETRAAIKALEQSSGKAKSLDAVFDIIEPLEEWLKKLEALAPAIRARGPAVKLDGTFPYSSIPDRLELEAPYNPAGKAAAWQRITDSYEFQTSEFDRSFAKETKKTASVSGVSLRYETTLADGTKITYFPHDPSVAWAMQGIVKIDAPGKGAGATSTVFKSIEEIGIDGKRAGEVERQHLYLNAFARIRLLRGDMAKYRQQFDAVTDQGAEGVRQKLDILAKATNIKVEDSPGWRTVDGVRQAFGHGRAHQLRPDLDTAEFEDFAKSHTLYHNPQGLGTDSKEGVFDRLKMVIEGGGTFASLTDRVRRGVPLSGSSVPSDLASGGGDYHFTRILKQNKPGTGVYWRARQVKRMDAITYESDLFGRTTGTTIEDNRNGQDVASLRAMANRSDNETVFKGGLSLFDDLDRIVLEDYEVKDAIEWMKAKGYKTWPDGRKIEEVIIGRTANRARY